MRNFGENPKISPFSGKILGWWSPQSHPLSPTTSLLILKNYDIDRLLHNNDWFHSYFFDEDKSRQNVVWQMLANLAQFFFCPEMINNFPSFCLLQVDEKTICSHQCKWNTTYYYDMVKTSRTPDYNLDNWRWFFFFCLRALKKRTL